MLTCDDAAAIPRGIPRPAPWVYPARYPGTYPTHPGGHTLPLR